MDNDDRSGGNSMTASVTDPCGQLDLAHSEAWAAHATVEQWLRETDESTDEVRLERISRILERIETDGVFTADELSLLTELCETRLDDSETPTHDHSALRAVIDAATEQHETCAT